MSTTNTAKPVFAHTERTVLDALHTRHEPKGRGNGPEWAFLEHVRNDAGFKANRTIDALALNLWPSRGMELHGYEVKVSRADFRREIADPAKMDAFAHLLDRFWIVAPKGIVPRNELPVTWGLLEVGDDGTSIRQKVAAPLLTKERASIPREFLVPLLRAAGARVKTRPEEMKAQYERGFKEGEKEGHRSSGDWRKIYEQQGSELKEARDLIRSVDTALSLNLDGIWKPEDRTARLAQVAAAVKAVMDGVDVTASSERAIRLAFRDLAFAQDSLDRARTEIENKTGVRR